MRKDLNVITGMHFDHRELGEWVQLQDVDVFKNKRVVIFSLPGAFTPTCSTQQLPGYEEKYEEFTDKHSIDEVYCISVNDAFVMNAWFDSLDIKNVKPIPDGSGRFTKYVNMLVDKDNLGFGYRSWRYAAVINDGIVEQVFIEPGFRNNADTDPFEVTDAQNVLNYLGGKEFNQHKQYNRVYRLKENEEPQAIPDAAK
jgi:peroxiredoxin